MTAQPPTATNIPATAITTYSNIATNNNVYETTTAVTGYAAHRFEITINQSASDVSSLTATWVGKGYRTSGNGATLYIWNGTGYEQLDTTSSGDKVTWSGSKTAGLTNYIDSNKKVILLVEQKSSGQSSLYTDYVKLEMHR